MSDPENEAILESMTRDVAKLVRVTELLYLNRKAVARIIEQIGPSGIGEEARNHLAVLMVGVLSRFTEDLEEAVRDARAGNVDLRRAVIPPRHKTH